MFLNQDEMTRYTVNNYKNIDNIEQIKFKGRKAPNNNSSIEFDPHEYVILYKNDDGTYYSYCQLTSGKLIQINYNSNMTIIPNHSEFEKQIVDGKEIINEVFTFE